MTRALSHLEALTDHFRGEGGTKLAGRFFDAADAALRLIEDRPEAGSTRIGDLWDIPGLRSWGTNDFEVRWFCFLRRDHVDVVRLLHESRDLRRTLLEERCPRS